MVKSCINSRGIVFVGAAGESRLHRVGQVEVLAHRRAHRHVSEQVPVVAERVLAQETQPGQTLVGIHQLVRRRDHDLTERVRHALAKLIGRRRVVVQKPLTQSAHRVVAGREDHRLRQRELIVEIRGDPHLLHLRQRGRRRAERGLLEKARAGEPRRRAAAASCKRDRGLSRTTKGWPPTSRES